MCIYSKYVYTYTHTYMYIHTVYIYTSIPVYMCSYIYMYMFTIVSRAYVCVSGMATSYMQPVDLPTSDISTPEGWSTNGPAGGIAGYEPWVLIIWWQLP